jgi:hypothetical protein
MNIFAHDGVDHQTTAEAVGHSAGDTVLTVLLISAGIVIAVAAILYALKRFALIKESAEKEEK